MRNTAGWLAAILLVLSPLLRAQTSRGNIYVSPTGSDANPGTMQRPLATITAALHKLASSHNNKVNIWLRKGDYAQEQPIVVTPALLQGHQLQLAAYAGEQVTINGSIPITPQWKPYKNKVLQAFIGKGLVIDRLFCNGHALPMARYPDFDSTARVFNGTAADAIGTQRSSRWAHPAGGYVHALHQGEWGSFHYRITGKTANDSLLLEGGWQNNRPAPLHKRYRFVENIFEELDAPGEWYYNALTGILYLYPPNGSQLKTALFRRSVLDDIIQLKGTAADPVQQVTISGINFTGTNRTFMRTKEPILRSDWTIYRGGAILLEGTAHVSINQCTFYELGGNAVFVSKYNRHDSISHNHIHTIGASAIAFAGDTSAVRSPSFAYNAFVPVQVMDKTPGPKNNNYPDSCTAYDNLVDTIGTIEKQVAGIEIDIAMHITASHNTIYHTPRAGINIGDGCWGGHLVAFNDVFNTVLETGDHGAYNSWGRDRYWLPGINDVNRLVAQYPGLPFLDAMQPITLLNNRFACEHGWDIDLDDGSSNYLIYNNVCLNGGLKLREGFNRIVENNILVNNTFHPHVWYNSSRDVFAHNIVTAAYAPIRINVWGKQVDSNFFIRQPALLAAQQYHIDSGSIYGDPAFVNDAAGNFTVKAGSKAFSIGFHNFPVNEFGVVSPSLKRLAAAPRITGISTLDTGKKGATTTWQGAVIKNVETLGEQSASGIPDQQGVLVVKVAAGSNAEKSGLEAGDVIRSINDKPVAGVADMLNSLQVVLWQGHAQALVWHNQQPKEMQLKLK